MRADQLLVERGLAASRSQAARLIAGGLRWRDRSGAAAWHAVGKNGEHIPASAELELADAAETRYVSRGGLKLEGALVASGIDARGKHCLDVGQSTGGFTDCLLQHGASHVVGVDVGHGQLHPRLADDQRVTAIEKLNARTLSAAGLIAACAAGKGTAGRFGSSFELIVGDLSFISLTLVLPALVPLLAAPALTLGTDVSSLYEPPPEPAALRPVQARAGGLGAAGLSPQGARAAWGGPAPRGGDLLLLVKPQFELQPGQVGKGGIVRDPALYAVVEQRLRAACNSLGLHVERWFASTIAGGDGNREFFVHAIHPQR